MTDVMELFDEFKQEFKREGFADPRPFLDQVASEDRATLLALIDAYLEVVPPASADEAAYVASAAKRLVSALDEVDVEGSTMWSRVLPRLRRNKDLSRRDVVAQLASELGLDGGEDLVKAAFHDMESGLLDSDDVQAPVLEALARMLGESADSLRVWGRRFGAPRPTAGAAAAYARETGPAFHSLASKKTQSEAEDPHRRQLERRIDELFRGGGGSAE